VAFNGVITFWNVETSQKSVIQDAGYRDWFPTLAFSPNGTKLASVGAESTVIFDGGHGILFSSGRPDHLIRLTDVGTGRELATLPHGSTNELTFSPDGRTVAFSGFGEIRLWNTQTGNEQEIHLTDPKTGVFNMPRVTALAFSPNGARLVSGTERGKIQMWDVVTGGALAAFEEPTAQENLEQITAVAFSPDGTLLAVGTHRQVHLWDVNTGHKLFSLSTVHKRGRVTFHNYAEPLVFSPDGAILVNGTTNGTIQVWDVATGDKIAALDGHTQKVETLKFSPDAETLVSTAMDGTIFLWDWDEVFKDTSGSDK
jgi:WD40 repeat protein